MILNHLLNSEMKPEELYELRIGTRVTTWRRSAMFGKGSGSQLSPTDLTYVNSAKAPMTGTSITDSLNLRNLTRFLWLGIARLMGKKTFKGDNTISYQTLRYVRARTQISLGRCKSGTNVLEASERLIEQSRCLF